MLVDHEVAWLKLKALIASKSSHGKKDLLVAMGEIEVESMVPEGQEGFDPRPAGSVTRLRAAGDR